MKPVNIKSQEKRAFVKICKELGSKPVVTGRQTNPRGYEDLTFQFSQPMISDWRGCQGYINSGKDEETKKFRASVLYSLYSTGNLFLKNHPYSSIEIWKQENPGMTLDHKMPKSKFPELTFVPGNWQSLSLRENRAKGSKIRRKECSNYFDNLFESSQQKMKSYLI